MPRTPSRRVVLIALSCRRNQPNIYTKPAGSNRRKSLSIIKKHLSDLKRLCCDVSKIVKVVAGQNLAQLSNEQVGVNVDIALPSSEYRWHYDRNKLTAILYLNTVEGGETEYYPNYRLFLERIKFLKIQKWLDKVLQLKTVRGVFGKRILLKPQQGTLVLMQADKCLHSVRSVSGNKDRINVILAYDTVDADCAVERGLGNYLYNQNTEIVSDPNYK